MNANDLAIGIGAFIAALALIPMYFTIRQGENRDRREGWQRRVDELEEELDEERTRRERLEEENLRLMRLLLDNREK